MYATPRKLVFSLALLLLTSLAALPFAATAQAADDFFNVDLTDLQFATEDGKLPSEVLSRLRGQEDYIWMGPGSLRAEVAGGEAYLTPLQRDWRSRADRIDNNASLVVRARAGADVVQGVVFLPEPYHFTLPDTAEPSAETRDAFYLAKENYYTRLQQSGASGAAWFRHVAHQARVDRLGDAAEDDDNRPNDWQRRSEFDNTYAMFSGGRALSENIQLDRLLQVRERGAATEPLAEIEGITIEEVDWEPLLADADPELDPLASYVPADQHALFFPSFAALANMIDEAQQYGTPLLRSIEPNSEDARTLERYQRQLCLTLDFLSRQLGPQAVKSVAMTGSDPYFRTGTDVAVLFEADEAGLTGLAAFVSSRYETAVDDYGAGEAKGRLAGHEYLGVVTPDRSISSYMCRLEGALVVTNSLAQLEQILATASGDISSLASLEEYKFFRTRYDRNDPAETAFLMVSDATIRRWCGPKWRIATSRRTRAMAILAELQSRHVQEIATGFGAPARLELDYNMADMGDIMIDDAGPVSSVYGSLAFNTPIRELQFDMVTPQEETAYIRYRDRYQGEWRTFFDPIGIQFTLTQDQVGADMTIMPLVDNTQYGMFIEVVDGVAIDPHAGDPHEEALVHWIMAINKDSQLFQQQGGMLNAFAPDRGNPLGWLGDSVSVYVDEDPFWGELAACEDEEARREFMNENYNRIPIALRAEVSSSLKAAAFLASLRAFIQETAPDMTVWGTERHREKTYVTITGDDLLGGRNEWTLYYYVSPDSLTLSLNEDLITRVIDRQLDGVEAEDDAADEALAENPNAPPAWLGESMALRVDGVVLLMLQQAFHDNYLRQMQASCYSNLAILNEWHARYPDRDPVELHEQLYKTRLVCPGGGEYVWNEDLQTMESTVYGSPAERKDGPLLSDLLSRVAGADFGLTFENDGLRARMQIERAAE